MDSSYEERLAYANHLHGSDHTRFADFTPMEVELLAAALLEHHPGRTWKYERRAKTRVVGR